MVLVVPGKPLYSYVEKSVGRIAVAIIFQPKVKKFPTIGRERWSTLLSQTGSDIAVQPMGRNAHRGQFRTVARPKLF